MNIGQICKAARIAKGYPLRQVEKETAVSNGYLSQLENGKVTSPSVHIVYTLCSLYSISIDEIFNGKKEQPDSQWSELNIYLQLLNNGEKEETLNYIKFLISKRK